MAQGALNTDRCQPDARGVEKSRQPNNGIQSQQCQGCRRIIEIDVPAAYSLHELLRKGINVYFETEIECSPRTQAARNCLVQPKLASPKGFITKSIEAKRLSTFGDHRFRILQCRVMPGLALPSLRLPWEGSHTEEGYNHSCQKGAGSMKLKPSHRIPHTLSYLQKPRPQPLPDSRNRKSKFRIQNKKWRICSHL